MELSQRLAEDTWHAFGILTAASVQKKNNDSLLNNESFIPDRGCLHSSELMWNSNSAYPSFRAAGWFVFRWVPLGAWLAQNHSHQPVRLCCECEREWAHTCEHSREAQRKWASELAKHSKRVHTQSFQIQHTGLVRNVRWTCYEYCTLNINNSRSYQRTKVPPQLATLMEASGDWLLTFLQFYLRICNWIVVTGLSIVVWKKVISQKWVLETDFSLRFTEVMQNLCEHSSVWLHESKWQLFSSDHSTHCFLTTKRQLLSTAVESH